jgi:hypothetical protein
MKQTTENPEMAQDSGATETRDFGLDSKGKNGCTDVSSVQPILSLSAMCRDAMPPPRRNRVYSEDEKLITETRRFLAKLTMLDMSP